MLQQRPVILKYNLDIFSTTLSYYHRATAIFFRKAGKPFLLTCESYHLFRLRAEIN